MYKQSIKQKKHFSREYPAIYIVATPIGNLEDITLRALHILENVDLILCEDARVTVKLLEHYGITTKCTQFDDYASENQIAKYITMLRDNKSIALVSDAGTPLISDPGFKLLVLARRENIKIESIPGPCSVINALVLGGLYSSSFSFIGFLPHQKKAKTEIFISRKEHDDLLVCFESPNRLIDTLTILAEISRDIEIAISREMTKKFEEVISGKITEVIDILQTRDSIKGEIVLMIQFPTITAPTLDAVEQLIKAMVAQKIPINEIAKEISKTYGLSKKEAYAAALAYKQHFS